MDRQKIQRVQKGEKLAAMKCIFVTHENSLADFLSNIDRFSTFSPAHTQQEIWSKDVIE